MNRIIAYVKPAAFLLVVVSRLVFADTQQEIDHLLDYVSRTPCKYERNGTMHVGTEAREHIYMKYAHYKKRIRTAEDFIRYSATRSKMSGKKYRIHCPDVEPVYASDWLLAELKRFRDATP